MYSLANGNEKGVSELHNKQEMPAVDNAVGNLIFRPDELNNGVDVATFSPGDLNNNVDNAILRPAYLNDGVSIAK